MESAFTLKMQRQQLRVEFDKLSFRKRRAEQRLDELAKAIETLTIEIAALEIQRDYKPIGMVMG